MGFKGMHVGDDPKAVGGKPCRLRHAQHSTTTYGILERQVTRAHCGPTCQSLRNGLLICGMHLQQTCICMNRYAIRPLTQKKGWVRIERHEQCSTFMGDGRWIHTYSIILREMSYATTQRRRLMSFVRERENSELVPRCVWN